MRNTLLSALLIFLAICSPARADQPSREPMLLKGHTDAVLCVAISSDGKQIATGSNDSTAIIWNAQTGAILHRLPGHRIGVTAVGFSADGSRLVTGSLDRTARVWDTKSGALIAVLQNGHTSHVHDAAISPDGKKVITASCDHTALLWDVETEKIIQRFPQAGQALHIAFSPDAKTFAVGCTMVGPGRIKSLKLYETATGNLLQEHDASFVDGLAYMEGGKRLLIISNGLKILNIETQKIENSKLNLIWGVTSIAPAKDGVMVLTGGEKGAIAARLDLSNKILGTFTMKEEIRAVAISPDSKWGVVVGGGSGKTWGNYTPGRDYQVKVMSLPITPGAGPAFVPPPQPPLIEGRLTMSRDGSSLMAYYLGGGAIWWNAATGKEIARLPVEHGQTTGTIAGDGSIFALSEGSKKINVYNAKHAVLSTLTETTLSPFTLALNADGKILYASGARRADAPADQQPTPPDPKHPKRILLPLEVHVYDLASGHIVSTFHGPIGSIVKMELSPDGKTLLGLCNSEYGGELAAFAWDVPTGRQLWKWSPPTQPTKFTPITAPAWASDSRTVAFAFDHSAIVINPANGNVIAQLVGHTTPIRQMAFDPDGKRLWSGADKDVVRIWDWATGKQLNTVKAEANYGVFRFVDAHHELIKLTGSTIVRFDLDKKD